MNIAQMNLFKINLHADLGKIIKTLESQSFDTRQFVFGPCASESELIEVETFLGHEIPQGFRNILRFVSAHVEFQWFAPPVRSFPEPFSHHRSGGLHWSLAKLREFHQDKANWINIVFKDPHDEYDRVWHNKLVFQAVGNGDYLAIDLDPRSLGQIVYLSHDDGWGHGYVMAESFLDLIKRWVPLACVGAESWHWHLFTNSELTPIDPTSETANNWRGLLCIDV